MTGILEQLKWESLKKRRMDNQLILLYKGLNGKARIPTDDLILDSDLQLLFTISMHRSILNVSYSLSAKCVLTRK